MVCLFTDTGYKIFSVTDQLNGSVKFTELQKDNSLSLRCNFARVGNNNNLFMAERGTNNLFTISNCGLGEVSSSMIGVSEKYYGKVN